MQKPLVRKLHTIVHCAHKMRDCFCNWIPALHSFCDKAAEMAILWGTLVIFLFPGAEMHPKTTEENDNPKQRIVS